LELQSLEEELKALDAEDPMSSDPFWQITGKSLIESMGFLM
jgi:hypothetical protein